MIVMSVGKGDLLMTGGQLFRFYYLCVLIISQEIALDADETKWFVFFYKGKGFPILKMFKGVHEKSVKHRVIRISHTCRSSSVDTILKA